MQWTCEIPEIKLCNLAHFMNMPKKAKLLGLHTKKCPFGIFRQLAWRIEYYLGTSDILLSHKNNNKTSSPLSAWLAVMLEGPAGDQHLCRPTIGSDLVIQENWSAGFLHSRWHLDSQDKTLTRSQRTSCSVRPLVLPWISWGGLLYF